MSLYTEQKGRLSPISFKTTENNPVNLDYTKGMFKGVAQRHGMKLCIFHKYFILIAIKFHRRPETSKYRFKTQNARKGGQMEMKRAC